MAEKYIVLSTTKTTGLRLVVNTNDWKYAKEIAKMCEGQLQGEGGLIIIAEVVEAIDVELT